MALHQAVGWCPIGMPFVNMTDHWQSLRTNVAGVFHTTFMNKYFDNSLVATQHFVSTLGANGTFDARKSFHELTYESASIGLFGAKIETSIPFEGKEGTVPFQVAQHQVIKDYAQHAVDKRFYSDNDYRVKAADLPI